MRPGDKLIFYLTKIMKFGGLAEVTSDYFEDHTRVFKSEKKPVLSAAEGPGEDYPFRVNVKPEIVLTPEQYLDVKEIAPRMEYTKKWPAEHWRLAPSASSGQASRGTSTRFRSRTTTSSSPR